MQAGAARQPGIDERRGVVQPPARSGRESLREPADVGLRRELDVGQLEAAAAVDPHLARAVDDHVRRAGHLHERLERADAHEILSQGAHQLEDRVVPQHQALRPQRRGHPGGGRVALMGHEPGPDPVEERAAHATRASVVAIVRSAA